MMKKYKLRFQSYLAPFTKELRTRRRSTQERMAEQLRITTRSYSDLERDVSVGSSQPHFVGSIEPIIVGNVRANGLKYKMPTTQICSL